MPQKQSTHSSFFIKYFSPLENPRFQNLLLTMSEPSHLVPYLNEIMEEYAKREEEAVQATQVEIGQEEERAEARAELCNQLKRLKIGGEELKKLELSKEKKKQTIWS